MNNLKRILSLALASVMVLGMMVVGASATEFTDDADITNTDAVDTLVALNVIGGMGDGTFQPNGNVTRAQMAKMIAFALNGGKDPNVGLPTTMTFKDVPATYWGAEYIEYCANLGIIGGRGDGTFDPEGKVTGQEAAKMMLVAMGFDADDFVLGGANWAVNTDMHASERGLYDGVRGFSRNAMTRENAAQLIYNGILADTVARDGYKYGSAGISYEYDMHRPSLLATCFGAEMNDGQLTSVSYDPKTAVYTYKIDGVGNAIKADVDVSDKIGQTVNVVTLDGDVVAITTQFKGALSSGIVADLNTKTEGKLDGYKVYSLQSDVKVYTVDFNANGSILNDSGKNATNYNENGNGNVYDAYRLVDLDQDSVIDLMVVFPVTITRVGKTDAAGNVANEASLTINPATSTIPELEEGDYILATNNGKGGYTVEKATTVSGTVTSVRAATASAPAEARINGVWYKQLAGTTLVAGDLGKDKTLVLVGGAYAYVDNYDDGKTPAVSKDLAVIVKMGGEDLLGNKQAILALADGTVTDPVYVKAGKDTTTLDAGKLYNYKYDSGVYTLTNPTKASTGFGSELQEGKGYKANNTVKEAELEGKTGGDTYYINDDAVIIYAQKGTTNVKYGAMTGADLKALGGTFGTSSNFFYKTVDGLKYVQFAYINGSTEALPDARDAKGTESYGFVVSAVAKEYNVDDKSTYSVYTIWNGTSNVEVKEKGETAVNIGDAISFEDLGDGTITNVKVATTKVQITGFSVANGVLTTSGKAYTLTDNTMYFNVNTATGKEAGVAGTKLEISEKANAWIIVGTDDTVKAIFVDTVNHEIK